LPVSATTDDTFNRILRQVSEPMCATRGEAFRAVIKLMQTPETRSITGRQIFVGLSIPVESNFTFQARIFNTLTERVSRFL
jgi:hypothetical protein